MPSDNIIYHNASNIIDIDDVLRPYDEVRNVTVIYHQITDAIRRISELDNSELKILTARFRADDGKDRNGSIFAHLAELCVTCTDSTDDDDDAKIVL